MEPVDDPATVIRSTHRPLPLLPAEEPKPRTTTPAEMRPRRPSRPRPLQDARQAAGTLFPPRLDPSGRWRSVLRAA
jgi:hypothetical protein